MSVIFSAPAATPVIVAFPFAACINPLMVTLKQQSNDPQTTIHQYGDWCPHAVNGWAVTFGTGRRAWMKYRQRWCTYFCYKQANKKRNRSRSATVLPIEYNMKLLLTFIMTSVRVYNWLRARAPCGRMQSNVGWLKIARNARKAV